MNCRVCGTELPEGAMFCGECGSSVTANRLRRPEARDSRPNDTTILEPLPGPAVAGPAFPGTAFPSGVEALPTHAPVPSFTLEFSTGERVGITGSGLLGRRPVPQPGESFDQLVTISEPERSVSKTHLEFGQESGELWICDRYSANGTLIISADGSARLCEPGRRYRLVRGSRVAIAGEFFTVA